MAIRLGIGIGTQDSAGGGGGPPVPFVDDKSMIFDGVDEYVDLGSPAFFDGAGRDFTAACWFKTANPGPSCIYGKWAGFATRDWVLYFSGGIVYAYLNTGSGPAFAASSSTYSDGIWHLAIMSYDSAAGEVTIDIDGGADRVTSAGVALRTGASGSRTVVGARDNGGGTAAAFFAGSVDDTYYFDGAAFSAADCVALFNSGAAMDARTHAQSAGLAGYWWSGDYAGDSSDSSDPAARIYTAVGSADGTPVNMEAADIVADSPPTFNARAILFDGIDDYLSGAASSLNFDSTDPWSVSLWMLTESTNYQFMINKIDPAGVNAGWAVGLWNGKPILQLIHDLGAGWQMERTCTGPFVCTGAMKHLVYTYSGSELNSGIRLYVDGVEVPGYVDHTSNIQSPMTNTSPLKIGDEVVVKGAQFFDGTIDECAIFDRVLTPAEVASIYDLQASAQGKAGDISAMSGLLSWYRCGDAAGDSTAAAGTQHDAAGSNDLTAHNMTVGSTTTNNASKFDVRTSVAFDGVDDYLSVDASPPIYDYNTPFTVSAWFNSTAGTYACIISKEEGAGNYRGWELILHATGELRFDMTHSGAAYLDMYSLGSTYNSGTWYHVAAVYTAATPGDVADVSIYVNGSAVAMTTLSNTLGSNTIANAEPMRIGLRGWPSHLQYQGNITNVALYSRALSSAEVGEIYNSGSPPDLAALGSWTDADAWWRLGDGAGDTTDTPGSLSVAGPVAARTLTANNMTDSDIETNTP